MQLELNDETLKLYDECIKMCDEMIDFLEKGIYQSDFQSKEDSDYILDKLRWLKDWFECKEYNVNSMWANVYHLYGIVQGYEMGYRPFDMSKADNELTDRLDMMYYKLGLLDN